MAAVEAYCVKCREKREIKDPEQITMKNGRPAMQGTCPVCGTKLFRMLSGGGKADDGEAVEKAPKKEKAAKEPKKTTKKKS